MAKDKLTEYSATNASNDVIGDISVAEGMLPSAVNNALREQMTHLKNFADGTDGINVLSLDDDDASASIKIQAPSAVTTTTTLTLPDGDGDAGAMLQTDGSGQLAWSTAYRNRNLILNGACVIDQRNGGSSVTPADTNYTIDRWRYTASQASKFTFQQNAGSVTPPAGFENYMGFTVASAVTVGSSDYFAITQRIEGYNVNQLEFGTANAKTVTLSFWVRSSLTGTFGGSLRGANFGRSYPFTYSISSANTWEYKTVTVAGDTSGSYQSGNTTGLEIIFGLGAGSTYSGSAGAWTASGHFSATGAVSVVGTGSATWYVTGVQLEVGEQATPFEHRSYGDELAACQRYYYQIKSPSGFTRFCMSAYDTTTDYSAIVPFPVEMRSTPTLSTTGTASNYSIYALNSNKTSNAVPSLGAGSVFNAQLSGATASSSAGAAGVLLANNVADTFLGFSAEL